MILTLCIAVRGAGQPRVEDADGTVVSEDILALCDLHSLPVDRIEEDGSDFYVWYAVEANVSGRRTRGCPPAPRSYHSGGDPGEAPRIEDLRVEVKDCPALSAALADKYQTLFVEALHRQAEG